MKRTRKYVAALAYVRTLSNGMSAHPSWDNDSLYEELEAQGHFWDADTGEWSQVRKSTSIFQSDEGAPTGEFRLRVMAHPGEMDSILEMAVQALRGAGCAVTEVSGQYPNRKGPGVRVYVTAQRGNGK